MKLPDLLTPAEVAAKLKISRRSVLGLRIPKIRPLGKRQGKIMYDERDVLEYIKNNTEYPAEKGHKDGGRIQKKSKAVRLQGLPSRDHLQKIRLANQGGGETGGSGVPH